MNDQSSSREPVQGNAPISHGPVQEGSVGPVQQHQESVSMITGQQDGPSESPPTRQVESGTVVDGRTRQSEGGTESTMSRHDEGTVQSGPSRVTDVTPVTRTETETRETIVVSAGGHSGSVAHDAPVGGVVRSEEASAPLSSTPSGSSTTSESTPAGYASEGGKWPVRGDVPSAGVHIDDGGEISTAMAAPGEAMIPTRDAAMRASDAATGAGPYVDPGEDLERVGATSGLASGSTANSSWNVAATGYRSNWESRQGGAGRWEEAEPAYRYGHEMSGDTRYHGREFDESEPELRSGYESWARERGYSGDADDTSGTGGGAWDKVKGGAKEAWDKVRGKG